MRTTYENLLLLGSGMILVVLGGGPTAAFADDRDLLKTNAGDPLVMLFLDASGSMNLQTPCSQAQFDAGECARLCPDGDCPLPLGGDDPSSKLHQAKEALYYIVGLNPDLEFGFATTNSDELTVTSKHWRYEVSATQWDGSPNTLLDLGGGMTFPAIGYQDNFGLTWPCDEGSGLAEAGCYGSTSKIADSTDPDELARVQSYPKLGRNMNEVTTIFLRFAGDNAKRFQLIYRPVAAHPDSSPNLYGNTRFAVEIEAHRCMDNGCTATTPADTQVVYYDLISDFLYWDQGPSAGGFFAQSDISSTGECGGLEGNLDELVDRNADGYDLLFPTDPAPLPICAQAPNHPELVEKFLAGDFLPFHWSVNWGQEILHRLAPNTRLDPGADPDFRVATYLNDSPAAGEDFLRLGNELLRPIIADGLAPIERTVSDIRTFFDGCDHGSCPKNVGWQHAAQVCDPDLNCRQRFQIILTDGVDDCPGPNPCSSTAAMFAQLNIQTYIIGFGLERAAHSSLGCMAANGRTTEPYFPDNLEDLKLALEDIMGQIKSQARAFASASVPTVQNETSDKVFLSSFTPLQGYSTWPGRLDAFRRPLPLKDDNKPDIDRDCVANNLQAGCHLWNAADELLLQAPTRAEADAGTFKIGGGANERRIFYGKETLSDQVPRPLRLFDTPGNQSDAFDLWRGLNLSFRPGNSDEDLLSQKEAETVANTIMKETLRIKEVSIQDPYGGPDLTFTYVLGDIFHADPEVLSSPNNLIYFRSDLHGYRGFSRKHFWRRKMLVAAANDGMVHFFDSGVRAEVFDANLQKTVETFTDGTGKELFAYMPRIAMPIVRDQALGSKHIYSLDGPMAIADVFIDPLHNGFNNRAEDRGWRTVLIGTFREGGDALNGPSVRDFISGVYALDLTQPDHLASPPPTPEDPDPRPYPTPVGGLLPGCLRFGAGGDQQTDSACLTPAGSPHVFPAELWTFTDQAPWSLGGPYYLDEEPGNGNGRRDLGDTWSKPIIGRIEVCAGPSCSPEVEPNDVEERYVAIFGGGIDASDPHSSSRGSWVYMIDVETGRALYKRQVEGGVAAAPVVIDRDRDGIFDFFYIATTLGFVYKVDLTALTASGNVPALRDVIIDNSRLLGDPLGAGHSATVQRVIDAAWEPFKIFSTEGRPIYVTPTAFVVPDLDQIALAFGTGNRHNLWDMRGEQGRFYTIVDEDYGPSSAGLPCTEAAYALIDDDSPETTENYLLDPMPGHRGWVLQLDSDDRVITPAFVLVGVVVFTSFAPSFAADLDGDGMIDACARSGESRVFVIDAENANPFVDLNAESLQTERYMRIGDFTTTPYTDLTSTKNPQGGATGRTTQTDRDPTQEALQEAIRRSLMRFFPEGCRFNKSYSVRVNANTSDTGIVTFATIPIAFCQTEWRNDG